MIPQFDHDILTTAEAASYVRCCRQTLHKRARAGEIDHIPIGRGIFFRLEAVKKFIKDREVKARKRYPHTQISYEQ